MRKHVRGHGRRKASIVDRDTGVKGAAVDFDWLLPSEFCGPPPSGAAGPATGDESAAAARARCDAIVIGSRVLVS